MENKSHALWAGIFTVMMVCLAIGVALILSQDNTKRLRYHIVTSEMVAGLNPQAGVRYKGLPVGYVETIEFDQVILGQINITIRVNADTPITHATFATIGYQGVTGIAFIQLNDEGIKAKKLSEKEIHIWRIPMRLGLLEKLEGSSSTILANIETASQGLSTLFASEHTPIFLDALKGVKTASNDITNLVHQLSPTLVKLPRLVDQTEATLVSIQKLTSQTHELSTALYQLIRHVQDKKGPFQETLAHVEQISSQLEREAVPQMLVLTQEANHTLQLLNGTLQEIKSSPQSLLWGRPYTPPGPLEKDTYYHDEK